MQELKGVVKKFFKDRKYGYVEANGETYWFHSNRIDNGYKPCEDDKVIFIPKPPKEGKSCPVASRLRYLYSMADGQQVAYPPTSRSHYHQGVENYLEEAIRKIPSSEQKLIKISVDLDKFIGKTHCVQTNSDDDVFFAVRRNRNGHTRFVKNRQSAETTSLALVLRRKRDYWVIETAYFGKIAPPEPFSRRAGTDAWDFWTTHALTTDADPYDESTITKICPWKEKIA